MRPEQPTCPRPGFLRDGATHQLCPYGQAAGKHLEAVMALPLVIRQPCSLGAKARRARGREAKWKVLQGTSPSPTAGLGSQHPPVQRMARGEFPASASAHPSPACSSSRGFCN